MVKTSRRRRSKRRPKTVKKRKRKTKYSHKKKNHVGGGMIDNIWKSIKETSLFKDCKKSPTLEDFKRFIELVENGEVDKLADEIIKLSLKSLSKEQVVDKIEYVKRLSEHELEKQLKIYFPGLLEPFKQMRRGSLSKNSSASLVKSRSSKSNLSKSNLSKSNLSKKGGGDGGLSSFLWAACVVLLLFVMCRVMAHACVYCLGRRDAAAAERRAHAREFRPTRAELVAAAAHTRDLEMVRSGLGFTSGGTRTPHPPVPSGPIPGNSLEEAGRRAAEAHAEDTDFYEMDDPLIQEDSEIDEYIEQIKDSRTSESASQGGVQAEGGTCGVCLDEYEKGDEVVKLKSCGHTFHKGCITQWLRNSSNCPLCKKSLKTDSRSAGSERSGRRIEP